MSPTDWTRWHDAYDRPGSGLGDRLAAVREQVGRRLDADRGPVRVVSACAGDGRDVVGVLADRTDAGRVSAVLVEVDAGLAARAEAAAQQVAATVEVRVADAALSDTYRNAVPADLVLLCGIFGNVTDTDVQATIAAAPQLCAPGATVIWTRHRREPDLTPSIRGWFGAAGFEETAFVSPGPGAWAVGACRLGSGARPLALGRRWFGFVR